MLPTDVPEVTVEIWATQISIKNWARIIDYGPDNKNYFIAVWNNGTNAERDQVKIAKADSAIMTSDGALCPFTLNTPYHFSFTFKANADGSSNVRWMRRNATTGTVENFGQYWVPDWHLSNLASPKLYIGHSQYSSDADANAIYDEVRVWKGILTDDQLKASVLAGPDALPNVGTATTVTTVYWTGAVDNDVTNVGNWGKDGNAATSIANSNLLIPEGVNKSFPYIGYDPINLYGSVLMMDGIGTFPTVGGIYLAGLDMGATGKLVFDPVKFSFFLVKVI